MHTSEVCYLVLASCSDLWDQIAVVCYKTTEQPQAGVELTACMQNMCYLHFASSPDAKEQFASHATCLTASLMALFPCRSGQQSKRADDDARQVFCLTLYLGPVPKRGMSVQQYSIGRLTASLAAFCRCKIETHGMHTCEVF